MPKPLSDKPLTLSGRPLFRAGGYQPTGQDLGNFLGGMGADVAGRWGEFEGLARALSKHPKFAMLPEQQTLPTTQEIGKMMSGINPDSNAFELGTWLSPDVPIGKLLAIGPMFWKTLKGDSRGILERMLETDFGKRLFEKEVPGASFEYGTLQVPEESMEAAKRFTKQHGIDFDDPIRFEPVTEPDFPLSDSEDRRRLRDRLEELDRDWLQNYSTTPQDYAEQLRNANVAKRSPNFIRKTNVIEPDDYNGQFRVVEFTDEKGTAGAGKGATQENNRKVHQREFFINAPESARPGMKRREFLIPKERAYNMDADPDNLWEQTYTGPQQSIEDRMDRFERLVSEKYDMGYSGIESNYRAKMFRNVYDEVPRQKYSIGKYEAVPARSGEFTVNIDGRRSDYSIHYNTNGYEIRKGDELVDDLPLVTFLNVDRQGQHYMFGTDIDIQADGDRWLVSRMAKRRAKNRLSKTRPADPITAFADLIAHADEGGKTIVFDDPAKSMLAFSDSSYLWGGRTRRKLPAQDMDFEVGGGWQQMLKEQFGFKQVDGKWVRPPAHERTRFRSVNEALLFFTTET